MTTDTITVEMHEGWARIDLNRPELRNAFNELMIAELNAAIVACGANPAVRVIVLGGKGKSFCAGADLNWMRKMASYTEAENRADALGLAHMLRNLYLVPKPIIARVHGDCYAGGMGLVAACDLAIAVPEANFCLSEVRLGLIPATISPYVVEAIGVRAARRYFLSAERFGAGEASRLGLIHEIAPLQELDQVIERLVATLLGNSPHAMQEAKRLIRDVAHQPIDEALIDETAERIALIRACPEGREGVSAFLEKRSPAWLSDTHAHGS
ncbi:MAG: enoyl-CoA hydratase/isomerase family protein [Burkholderiaceae bacterium]